jgi:hypothetical protein
MPAGPVKVFPVELTQTEFVPVIVQFGRALTVTTLLHVLVQPLLSAIVSVSVNEPAIALALTETF